jgi:tetratricopeptide (TPR) repeat protein
MKLTFTQLKAVFILALSMATTFASAQSSLPNAWKAFYENKRAEARTLFTAASQQGTNADEALLGLSLLAQVDRSNAESFEYFKKFCAATKNPQPYIYALWTTPSINEGFGKKSPEQIAFLREIIAHKDYDGMLAAMAYSMIGEHFETSKKFELADKEYKNIGSLNAWQITGEFENISTSGFDKPYETVQHPEAEATFTNKNGVKNSWFEIPYVRHDRWIDFTYYSNAYNSIDFAQTFVKSDNHMEAQLRIGVSGSVKVWVNDKQLLSEADERNNDLDTYIQTIKLNKGYNRILVQIGESYAERSNFMVRLTDNQGVPIPGLTCIAKAQPYTKETAFVSQKIEPFAITYFEQQIKAQPDNLLPQLLIAQAYLRNDKTFEARRVVENMRKKYPNSTFLNAMLLDIFNKDQNRTGAETIKETMKMADPESSIALIMKFNELIEQKEYDKAADVIKRLEELQPDQAEFILKSKINLAGYNKNQDEVVKLAEEAYVKYPDNSDFMGLKYLIEANLRKNLPKALEVLKSYVDTHDNYTVAKELAAAYFAAGKASEGLKVYQDEIKLDPIGIGIYSDLGDQYYKQQQYDKAAQCYLNCLQIFPTSGDYYTSLGKIYEESNQKDKAIQAYQKGLEYEPNDYATIKSLRKLQNKKDVFSYFEEPNVDALIRNAPKASEYPDDNYLILDQEVQKVVYQNGGSEERQYMISKILTQKGIESWKEYSIGYDNWQNLLIETAEVIKANGNKVPAERNENNLVFTNLEVGDVINIRYKVENYYKGKLANHFWDSFYFTNGNANVKSKYSLLISKDKKFDYKFSQSAIIPQKKTADEFDLYVWQNADQHALTYEDKMPPLADVANILYLTSIPDWKFISDWYNDLASAKARTNYEVKQVISDLFPDKSTFTPMQKVESIYNYITTNISYSSVSFRQSGLIPQNPSNVLNTRIGDCKDVSTLFVSMCKEAGIKAQLVLVKTRDNGLNTMPLPNIDFNHCIAKVNLNNQEYYIELTSQYLPFRSQYNTSLNSVTLDIGDGNSASDVKYLNPITRKANNISRVVDITFRDKDMLVKEKGYKTAALAGYTREVYKELSQKDRIKKIKNAISNVYPDNEITRLDFTNLDAKANKDTVYSQLDYELRNTTKSIAGMSIFSLPWSDKMAASDLQVVSPRYSGIDLDQMFSLDSESEAISITLPLGKKVVEPFAPLVLNNDVLNYSITSKTEGNKLIITRTFKLKKDFIPSNKVPEFNEFFKKIVEADNREIAMK